MRVVRFLFSKLPAILNQMQIRSMENKLDVDFCSLYIQPVLSSLSCTGQKNQQQKQHKTKQQGKKSSNIKGKFTCHLEKIIQ